MGDAIVKGAIALGLVALLAAPAHAKYLEQLDENAPPKIRTLFQELDKLQWVDGPSTVQLAGNASITIPAGYVFLNEKDTQRFLELNENLGSGDEVMIAPEDLAWSAYLTYLSEGYVKDEDDIDADALLKQTREATEAANAELKRRGWSPLHIVGWAVAPNYNRETKRLEWAFSNRSDSGPGVNFYTKILGRRGHTSVQLVASLEDLTLSVSSLNNVLTGFEYGKGDRYADFRPGDRVAEYGLAAMIVGGAAAVATKKGFWAVLAGFFAASWKFLIVLVVGAVAWLKSLFNKRA